MKIIRKPGTIRFRAPDADPGSEYSPRPKPRPRVEAGNVFTLNGSADRHGRYWLCLHVDEGAAIIAAAPLSGPYDPETARTIVNELDVTAVFDCVELHIAEKGGRVLPGPLRPDTPGPHPDVKRGPAPKLWSKSAPVADMIQWALEHHNDVWNAPCASAERVAGHFHVRLETAQTVVGLARLQGARPPLRATAAEVSGALAETNDPSARSAP